MANESIAVLLTERNAEKMFPNTVIHLIEGGIGVFGNIVVLIMYTKYIADKSGSRYFTCGPLWMPVKRDRISPGQHNDVHLPKRCSVQNDTVSHDFDCGIFSSSDFLNCPAAVSDDLPPSGSTNDQKVLQNSHSGHFGCFIRIFGPCVKVRKFI